MMRRLRAGPGLRPAASALVLGAVLTGLVATPVTADHDDRILVSARAIDRPPFASIVLVGVGGRVACTGFVIGTRRVATAGHCLTRNAEDNDFRLRPDLPEGISLYRGYSQAAGGFNYPTCPGWRAWVHPRFVRSGPSDTRYGDRDFDYAVVTTSEDCTYPRRAILRLWPTSFGDGQLEVGQRITMAGYPSDQQRDPRLNGLNMWRSRGHLQSSFGDPLRLNVTGYVGHGMSGSPIWRTFRSGSPCGRRECVIGILTECAVNGDQQCRSGPSFRRGVRITPLVKRELRSR